MALVGAGWTRRTDAGGGLGEGNRWRSGQRGAGAGGSPTKKRRPLVQAAMCRLCRLCRLRPPHREVEEGGRSLLGPVNNS